MQNTRFYPTLNGECHLGHLLIALLNYHQAKNAGGVFIVRSELRVSYLNQNVTMGQMDMWYDSFKKAFDRVGIEAEYMPLLHDGQWVDEKLKEHEALHRNDTKNDLYPEGPAISAVPVHPYSPTWCLERVLLDNRYAVGRVIRGMDLISENSLYIHFCKILGLPVPKMCYSPMVSLKEGDKTAIISKTNGNGKVSGLVDKSKFQLLDLMQQCLVDVSKGFTLQNVKSSAVVSI